MNNFWAICIGIEEYLHYQPLRGAENRAQALYRYFFAESNKSSLFVLETEIITADLRSTKLEFDVSEN